MRHDVIGLRIVSIPAGPEWMTLAEAEAAGIDLAYVRDGIGPRVRGMVYRGGYCDTVNTVHDVFVEIAPPGPDADTGRMMPRRAVWWEVAEESAQDHGRMRRHCTSWEYDRRNQPLLMFTD